MMSFFFTFIVLSFILVARYFLLSGAFSYLNHSVNVVQRSRDIKWSLQSSMIFALFGAVMLELWKKDALKVYLSFNDYTLWYLPLSLGIYLFLHDTYFYWTHRWMHRYYFRKVHFAHHESRDPTSWTSFAFHPIEAIIQAMFLPLLAILIPVHLSVLGIYLLIMSVFGVTNHLGREIYPNELFKKLSLINATHHDIHHKKISYNFGLYFTFWDKWMGTEHP